MARVRGSSEESILARSPWSSYTTSGAGGLGARRFPVTAIVSRPHGFSGKGEKVGSEGDGEGEGTKSRAVIRVDEGRR